MIAQIFLSLVFILAAGIKSERMSNPQTTRLLATCPVGKYAKGSGCVTCKTGCSIAPAVVHPQADNRNDYKITTSCYAFNISCAICFGSSPSFCLTCNAGYYMNQTSCLRYQSSCTRCSSSASCD